MKANRKMQNKSVKIEFELTGAAALLARALGTVRLAPGTPPMSMSQTAEHVFKEWLRANAKL